MKFIAVPVHFTSRSLNAARYAADLAVALDAELQLLFVNPVLPVKRPLSTVVIEEIRNSGLEFLKSLVDGLRERTGGRIRISTDQQTGEVDERLRAFCRETRPSLMVLGGPVEQRIHCPVLSVPGNASFEGVKSVVIACDRDDILSGMPDYLPFLTDLYNSLGCQFQLVHVISEGKNSISRLILEYGKWKSRPGFFPVKLNFLRQDDLSEGISEYVNGHDVDWLTVLPKTHNWIEFHDSQAKSISDSCEVPVLSVYD